MSKLRYFLALIVILIAVFVIYPEFKSSFGEIPNILKNADKLLILIIVLLQLLTYVSDGLLTKILLKIAGSDIPLFKTLKISIVDTVANLTLPLIGGQVIKYYFYRKLKVPASSILFLITSWTMFFYITAIGFFVVSIFFIPQNETLIPLNLAIFFVVIVTAGFYFFIRKGNKFFISLLHSIGMLANRFSLKFRKKELVSRERLHNSFANLELTFRELKSARKAVFYAIGASFLYYFFDILTIYVSFLVFGFRPNIFVIIFGFTVSSILAFVTAIPYVPGVIESSLALVFVQLGYPANISLLASLLFRIFSYWLPMPFGLVSYLDFRRGSRDPGNNSKNGI